MTATPQNRVRPAAARRSMERLEDRALLAGLNLLVDSFIYASSSAAQAAWVAQEQSAPATPATGILGQSALQMTANFGTITPPEGAAAERAYWDRAFSTPLDFSTHTGFEIAMYSADLSPITSFNISFRTGAEDWYRFDIATSQLSTTAWSTIVVDMKSAAVEDSGAPGVPSGWNRIERIRIAAHALPTQTTDATFYLRDLKATGREQIDNFIYATPAEAQSQWVKGTASSGLATPATNIAGRDALGFPVNFATVTTDQRAYWDRTLDLDLSWARGVQFQVYSSNPSPISYVSLYFGTAAGWSNYYTTSFYVADVSAWNTVSIDLAEATVTGSPQWSKINQIRLSPWRAQNINTTFYLSDMRVFGGNQQIDRFEYASSAAAQAAWVEIPSTSQGPVTLAKDLQGGRALAMPVQFAGATSDPAFDRSSWDKTLALDLSCQRGVQFDVFATSLASISSMSLGFQSGSGWYEKTIPASQLVAGQWNTITITRQDMLAEGTPGAWTAIAGIRFSVQRDKDVTGTDSTVYLRDFRSLDPEILILRQEPQDTGYAATVASQLADAGVPFAGMSTTDVRADRLDRAKLLVLPYNSGLAASVTNALVASIAGGRKLLGFYTMPTALYTAIGMTPGSYYGSSYSLGSIRPVDLASLPGAPPVVNQASWNIQTANPVAGQSSVLAWWYNTSGVNTGLSAVVGSSRGIVMTHVLLSDDLENKERLLVAMADKLVSGTWASAAVEAMDKIGRVGPYADFPAATTGIAATATANRSTYRTQPYLDSAAAQRATAQAAMTVANYPAAFEAAVQGRTSLRQAYSAAQNPAAGELRAFFVHDAYGVPGQSWDTTVKQLAQSGFNAVAVNLLHAGGAYYDTNVQAFSDGTMFPRVYDSRGDQLALLVAATQKYGIDLYVWKTNWFLRSTTPQWLIDRMRTEGRLQWDQSNNDVISGSCWLDPAVQANRDLEIATMVELAGKTGVKGILFDYIRYVGSNTSYSPAGKAAFEGYLQSLGLLSSGQSAPWPAVGQTISSSWQFYSQWITWRQSNITDVVARTSAQARAANPDVLITAAVFRNWLTDKNSIGQDWVLWLANNYLDSAVPMDYTSYNSQLDNWITSQQGWAPGENIYPAITTSDNPSDRIVDQILITRGKNTGGFYVFNLGSSEAASTLPTLGLGTTLVDNSPTSLDADGNGTADALSDGILILRYLFDPSGAWNVNDALGAGATRTTREEIKNYLDGGRTTVLDADGNGTADALSDGILILRYLFDPAGAWNVNDALGSDATRTTREEIKAYLDEFNPAPPPAPGLAIDTALVVEQEPVPGTSGPSGSNFVQPAQAIAAAIVAGGGQTRTLKASGGLDQCASEVDNPSAGDEAAKVANLQALDRLLGQWDQPYERRIARLAVWTYWSMFTDDAEALDEFYGEGGPDWFLVNPRNPLASPWIPG